ncbi:MAG: hypothetical protein MUO67_18670, partial [Anaerolineales bacterium]|nr:hypothetical protein [Anaerolineales bacterium]
MEYKNELSRALRLTLWAVPALLMVIGLTYTVLEHRRHINDPVWPYPTVLALVVVVIIGPVLSWIVLRWSIRAADAYLVSQEQLAQRADELGTLNKLSVAASRSLDLKKTIAVILERTMEALDASAGMVFIQNDGLPGLRLEAHRGISVEMAQ